MNEILSKAAFHKKKIAIGTLITILYFGYPHFLRIYHWYEKVGETRDIAKENKKVIEKLQECERKESIKLTELEILIRTANKRLDKLEYKIDNIGE